MKPGALAYFRADSVPQAVDLLVEGGMDAKVLAGGQSLVPMLNLRMVAAERLVDVSAVPTLKAWSDDGKEVRIGACITHEQIQLGEIADPSNGLMKKVAAAIAYQAVRNRGTIGGSLALADPSADWVTTTAALGATIEWQGPDGPGSSLAEEFIIAAYTTHLGVCDLLTGIRIPRLDPDAKWGTYKICRKTGEFAHAMAMVIRAPKASRAFLGATDGAPIRLPHTEQVIGGLRDWQAVQSKVLMDAMDADLSASGRELTEVRMWQSRTCLLRSVQMSFGVEAIEPESV
jgi:carbon-monoxide dehydrogenase medium subunit